MFRTEKKKNGKVFFEKNILPNCKTFRRLYRSKLTDFFSMASQPFSGCLKPETIFRL